MQGLEVSGAVPPLYGSLGVRGLRKSARVMRGDLTSNVRTKLRHRSLTMLSIILLKKTVASIEAYYTQDKSYRKYT